MIKLLGESLWEPGFLCHLSVCTYKILISYKGKKVYSEEIWHLNQVIHVKHVMGQINIILSTPSW